ncbi:MAG: hypothetical protein IJ848_01580 [Alphaproteobacteria bacterium]|nr:hypothetical protein [Alphaproteobacteria bacterium]
MSGYLYKEFIDYVYNNPLIILIYSLLLSFITLYINKKQIKPILYLIVFSIIIALESCLYTNNLLYFIIGIETYNILFILLLYNTCKECVKKVLLLSMIISSIMLFGTTLVLLDNNSFHFNSINMYSKITILGLSFVLIGILFKLCVFPFHIWILDVYKKSPYYIVLLIDCFFKLILLRALLEFITNLPITSFNNIFAVLGTISIFIGMILSIRENNIKRFLGLFNISHIGLILLLISTNNINNYITVFGYLLMYSTCSLFFLLSTKDNIENFIELPSNRELPINNRLAHRNISMLSLIAMLCIPPFHTFLSKVDLILITLKDNRYILLLLIIMYFILEIVVILMKLRFYIKNTKSYT